MTAMAFARRILDYAGLARRSVPRGRHIKWHRTSNVAHRDRLTLGEYVYVGPRCFVNAEGGVTIGDGTILGPEVVILSSSHDFRSGDLLPYDVFDVRRPVEIGSGVWIGYRAMICPGVTIGDGAVVALGAVVTRPVAAGAVVGGNPAEVISMRDVEDVRRKVAAGSYFHKVHWSGPRPRVQSNRA